MPRTSRDTRGNSAMLIATITFWTDALVSAIRAIASRIGGMDIKPSMTRMIRASIWRTNPDTRPIAVPMTDAQKATENPTSNDTREPKSTREYTSLPNISVPNQYKAEGSRVRRAGARAVGSFVPK
ncbi:hypothetical protein GALL_520400 [mine drainage metagenome]|uniref:Uncharacterized protein n=1 Tax=mine drainage metagenome TaxID=410659 RepID=A0A1J5P5C1_9ZZZZ